MTIRSAGVREGVTPPSVAARMLHVLAHEIRGPLAPIRNAATSLAMQIPEGSPSRKSVSVIERQVQAIEALIENILEAARLEHALLPVHRTRVNLAEAVAEALDAVAPYVAERGHALVAQFARRPLHVDGDGGQLMQIVRNLVVNAAKYTDRGGLIEVLVTAHDDTARICVRDTGIGLAPDKLELIFDLYAQVGQGGTSRSAGGLGVGLYVARQLVLDHGGTLTASSPGMNLGSEFVVCLPLAGSADEKADAGAA
jgi:signal transduction histidine kinase